MTKKIKRKGFDKSIDDWKKHNRIFSLPVSDPKNTEVLGWRATTKTGKHLWNQLDWKHWQMDGSDVGHIFSHPNCMYFHVWVKYKRSEDGPGNSLKNRRRYRVRCYYSGRKYKGWPVKSITVTNHNGRLHWVLHCKKESTCTTPTT